MASELMATIPLTETEIDTLSRIVRERIDTTGNKNTRATLRRVLEKLDHAVPS